MIQGTSGNDRLVGTEAADSIQGLEGDDIIVGNGGADTISGGGGNDRITVSYGAVSVTGDMGNDQFILSGISFGLSDTTFDGGEGADTFDARYVSSGTSFLFFTDDSFSGGSDVGSFNVADNHVRGVEVVRGGFGPNWFLFQEMLTPMTLYGGDSGDVFHTSFAHADVMFGYGGADQFGVRPGDKAYGGLGDDSFEFSGSGSGFADGGDGIDVLTLGFGWTVDLTAGTAVGPDSNSPKTFVSVENVSVSAWREYATSVSGNGEANRFSVDPMFNDGSVGVVFDGRGGNDELLGSIAADHLIGGAGNDRLDGSAGGDTLEGGTGNDSYGVDDISDVVTEAVNAGLDTVASTITYTLTAQVEDLILTGSAAINGTGNGLNNRLTGNALANTLVGGDGNDQLDGAGGADLMSGGVGTDLYIVDDIRDRVVEAVGGGIDTIRSSVTFALSGSYEVENLTLTGTSAINATGNQFQNTLTGNGFGNILNGAGGADTLIGGNGNDLYIIDDAGDVVQEGAYGGTSDTVQSSISHTLAVNVENLMLTGTAAIQGLGNALSNSISGNAAANRLEGGSGNDILNGAGGADTMIGGTGNDTYFIDVSSDTVSESPDGGTDTVRSAISYMLGSEVENLILIGSVAVAATGNALRNILNGNAAANILNGNAGADAMAGLAGDDRYIVDDRGDRVFESNGGGTDQVFASVDYYLSDTYAVENLTLTGNTAQLAVGNRYDNVLIGNTIANSVYGGAGADYLFGKEGSDRLHGGAGSDRFYVDTALGAGNVDTILDFAGSEDTFMLYRGVFGGLSATGPLGESAFAFGTAASDATDRIVYDQATGRIFYDADGSGAGASMLFAQVTAGTVLTSADFFAYG
jgi:Ca2+-binding RTX toxin-like protein